MFCFKCGWKIDQEKFCPNCGTPTSISRSMIINQETSQPETQDTTNLYSAFIKHNRDYYLKNLSSGGWNFSAFAFSCLWFFYRKMIGIGLIFAFSLLLALFISIFFPIIGLVCGLMVYIMSGILGNKAYKRHIDAKIRRLRESGKKDVREILQKENDTSVFLPICMGIVYLIVGTIMRESVYYFLNLLLYAQNDPWG